METSLRTRPPKHFLPARDPHNVRALNAPPPFMDRHKTRRRGVLAAGLRYERKMGEWLVETLPNFVVIPAQWFSFLDGPEEKLRWCQIDCFAADPLSGRLCLFEFKLRHCADSWWQLTQLYQPVLECIFPPGVWNYRLIEVCRWFDPTTYYPVVPNLLREIPKAKGNCVNVHIRGG